MRVREAGLPPRAGPVDDYGRCAVSRKLEAALRAKAGDYLANRILRDHRLPREEMDSGERKRVLAEFIEAMAEYLGKDDAQAILVEVGRGERPGAAAARRVRADACGGGGVA